MFQLNYFSKDKCGNALGVINLRGSSLYRVLFAPTLDDPPLIDDGICYLKITRDVQPEHPKMEYYIVRKRMVMPCMKHKNDVDAFVLTYGSPPSS